MELIIGTIMFSIFILAAIVKRYQTMLNHKEDEIVFLTGTNIELKEDVAHKEYLLSELRNKCSGLIAKNRNQKSQISHNEKQLKILHKEKESIMKQVRQLEKIHSELETDYDNLRYVLERTERDLEVSHKLNNVETQVETGHALSVQQEDKDRYDDVLTSASAGFDAIMEDKSCVSMK